MDIGFSWIGLDFVTPGLFGITAYGGDGEAVFVGVAEDGRDLLGVGG